MEEIKLPLELFRKALETLHDSLRVMEKAELTHDQDWILAAQDSIIQRFEYCFDSFWKLVKRHLKMVYDFEDANSLRSVFREMVHKRICHADQGELLQNMVLDRNITTHNYDIDEVREILPKIKDYYGLMNVLLHLITQELMSRKIVDEL